MTHLEGRIRPGAILEAQFVSPDASAVNVTIPQAQCSYSPILALYPEAIGLRRACGLLW